MNRLKNRFRAGLSIQDQATFARRLSMLIKSGVPILQGLQMLKGQARAGANTRMLERVIHDVSNGQYLWKSFSRYHNVFGQFAVNIIKVGETSGTLHENLRYLSDELEKKQELRRKLFGAMVYPVTLLVASLGIAALLTVYLFPKLLPVFKSLNVPLPITTRALIAISDFLLHYGIWTALALAALVVAATFIERIRNVRLATHHILLRLPFIGGVVQQYQLANICRTLGLLLRGSVTVREAVHITSETTPNLVYQKELQNLATAVTRGGSISGQLGKHPFLFPSIMTQMIMIGEKTGNLSDTLMYLAELYEKEFDDYNKRFSSILEPALMLFMGTLVGFIAISIITPIYAVTQHLNP